MSPDLVAFYANIFKGKGKSPRRRRFDYSLDDLRKYGKRGLVPIRKGDGNGADDIDVDDEEVRRLLLDQQDADADENDDADEGEDDERDDAVEREQTKHLVDVIADLVVEGSEGRIDRPTALRHLLHTAAGNSLVHRMRRKRLRKRKERTMVDRSEGLRAIVKASGGLEAFCKALTVDPSIGASLSEHEFTSLVTEEARKLYPGEPAATAFAKLFSSVDDGYLIRQAHAIINSHGAMNYLKGEPLQKAAPSPTPEPRVSGDSACAS